MNEQELNKKLAEWAGWKYDEPSDGWWKPTGHYDGRQPNFTQSLDACFKWLVPRLWICDIRLEEGIFWFVRVAHPDYGEGKADGEDLALALCLAIEKLIDNENI